MSRGGDTGTVESLAMGNVAVAISIWTLAAWVRSTEPERWVVPHAELARLAGQPG